MRYVLALLLLSACATPPLREEPTGVVVAAVREDRTFDACEIVLDRLWSSFESACGQPEFSLPWRGGYCHFYATNTVGFLTGTGAPYVAICESTKRYGDAKDVNATHEGRVIQLVVGLRELPAR